jgi:hypothetical protein
MNGSKIITTMILNNHRFRENYSSNILTGDLFRGLINAIYCIEIFKTKINNLKSLSSLIGSKILLAAPVFL